MEPERAWDLLNSAEVAVLGTIGPDGASDLVPVVFAPSGPRTLVSPVDQKPKSTRRLRRLDNIEADPRVSLLAQHWDHDWSRLWWVRAEGRARVEDTVDADMVETLVDRYEPYRTNPPRGPWIVIDVDRLLGWEATG